MFRILPFASMQSVAAAAADLERLAGAEMVTAIATAVLALLGLGIAVLAFLAFRAVTRTLAAVERTVDTLAPHTEPILEQAARIASDAARVSASVREDLERFHETIRNANRQLQAAVDSIEDRVVRFGVVARVVQEEVEAVLLDAAATARGVHAATEALQGRSGPPPDGSGPEHD
ncbi:MAG TPA: hypothetical protein VF188_08680 [Longimicrobiales bacterium]